MNREDLLKTEYFKLQDFYENFDSKVQTIKGWSATISIAAITFGFSYKNGFIWLFAALTALVFWIMEAKWKIFQYCYADRIAEIEKAFRNEKIDTIDPLQIYSSWFKAWEKKPKIWTILFMKIVMIPYVYTIIVCIALFCFQYFMLISFW
jgi:hypothetical protein